MQELKTINVTLEDGNVAELKVVTIIKKPNSDKKFLLYVLDDSAENVDIYSSELKETNGNYTLESISEEDDWKFVQNTIKELSD